MAEFGSIETLASEIKNKLDSETGKKKILALYAFNATGKTRLTSLLGNESGWFEEGDEIEGGEDSRVKVLYYSAFLEDMFAWDNFNCVLDFDQDSFIMQLVKDEGLERRIVDTFNDITNSKIEPSFNWGESSVSFTLATGDDASVENIKISRGEESVFIWSVFHTVLTAAIEALSDKAEDRTTSIFDALRYVVIDDPVSSIDDTKIVAMAVKLVETIKSVSGGTLKFFITTHHALFFNILANSFKRDSNCNFKSYCLYKEDNCPFNLLEQKDDSPFSYHLSIRKMIQNAIDNDSIEKYHFNLFRALLEKTANFLGHPNWADCMSGSRKPEFIKLLHLYSHGKLVEIEHKMLPVNDKALFKETFDTFTADYKWNQD